MKKRVKINTQLLPLVLLVIFFAGLSSSAFAEEYWASKQSNKYHKPDCTWAQKIKESNLIRFSSPEEAVRAGYVPCKVCDPASSNNTSSKSAATPSNAKEQTSFQDIEGFCERVVDGDTIVVRIKDRTEKIRLIGVDTPETVHPTKQVQYFGKEASAYTRHMVERQKVKLKSDWQERDKYGRLLAYVYLDDGTFLNAELIKQGYGFAYIKYPFKYLEIFKGYEKEARENKRGLWK